MNSVAQTKSIFQLLLLSLYFLGSLTSANTTTRSMQSFDIVVHGAGKPIILIPGLMSDGRVWDELVTQLAERYQLHVISIAGFAGTPQIEDQSLARVKQDLFTYISDQQLLKPGIVGHSLGGFMAMWLASSQPDAIGPIVSVDGLPFIGPLFTLSNQTTVADLAQQAQTIERSYANLSPAQLENQVRSGVHIQATSPDSKTLVVVMASQSDPKTVGVVMQELMSIDLRQAISHINGPALLLGAAGGFPNDELKAQLKNLYLEQMRALTSATVEMNNQSRHFIMYDQPQWFLQQVQNFFEQAL